MFAVLCIISILEYIDILQSATDCYLLHIFTFIPTTEGWGVYPFCHNICNPQKEASESIQSIYILAQHEILNWPCLSIYVVCVVDTPPVAKIKMSTANLIETVKVFARRKLQISLFTLRKALLGYVI